jgi:DNA-binding NtrC family response regulator
MKSPIKILLVEESPEAAAIVLRQLEVDGFAPEARRVDNETDFRDGLEPGLDVVLSDFQLSPFNVFRAMELLRQTGWDIPFIIVSGPIGEEVAVRCLHQGATDFLRKDRLARLGETVRHALRARQMREMARRSAETLKENEQRLLRTQRLESAASISDRVCRLKSWTRFSIPSFPPRN